MTLPVKEMPAAISESVELVLKAHGLSLSPDLLSEIGRNTTQALFSLDEGLTRPDTGELLAVGHTLRGLARSAPGAGTGEALSSVGEWLVEIADAEIAAAKGKAA